MAARAKPFFAVKKEAEECGLQEESEHAFHSERLTDHASGIAREVRPVRAKLKFHGNSSDHAQQEIDAENLRPETRRLIVDFILAAKAKGLEYNDQRRQTHGELREKIVESDGESEMNAMNKKSTIHRILPNRVGYAFREGSDVTAVTSAVDYPLALRRRSVSERRISRRRPASS